MTNFYYIEHQDTGEIKFFSSYTKAIDFICEENSWAEWHPPKEL